ncbi:MAG: SET domain-containing protein [Chitinophagales bacterium]
MIHPQTSLRYINDVVGYGVFAKAFIPKGTVIQAHDALEIEIPEVVYEQYDASIKQYAQKYAYINAEGTRVVSWDFAKYTNHCCDSNTLCTGYGFDLVIRDIEEGEEITCEYGPLNVETEMPLECARPGCRGLYSPTDFEKYHSVWDEKIKNALVHFREVEQPLLVFLEVKTLGQIGDFLMDNHQYQSVTNLKWHTKTVLV